MHEFRDFTLFIICIFFTFIFMCNAHADTITCYAEGKEVYSGKIKDLLYSVENANLLWFIDAKGDTIFASQMQCIAHIDKNSHKKIKRK